MPRHSALSQKPTTNILAFDTDLIFPKTKVELEMSGAMTPADMIAKIQDNFLSAGLISTFRTTAMQEPRSLENQSNKSKSTPLRMPQ